MNECECCDEEFTLKHHLVTHNKSKKHIYITNKPWYIEYVGGRGLTKPWYCIICHHWDRSISELEKHRHSKKHLKHKAKFDDYYITWHRKIRKHWYCSECHLTLCRKGVILHKHLAP